MRAPAIIIKSPEDSTTPATLIFFHGYNDTAGRFNESPPDHLSVAHHIHQSLRLKHVKIIIPEALPCQYPGLDNTWYKISQRFPSGRSQSAHESVEYGNTGRNEMDMNVSMDYIEELIQAEVSNGVPPSRIVLMGYSQGGAILSLFIATRKMAADIGTIITFAGIPVAPMQSIARMQRENGLAGRWSKSTRYFMLHGQEDIFMPLAVFHELRRRLEGFKESGQGIARLEWEVLEGMSHSMSERLWPNIRRILEKRVAVPDVKPAIKL